MSAECISLTPYPPWNALQMLRAELKGLRAGYTAARGRAFSIGTPRLDGMPRGTRHAGSRIDHDTATRLDLESAILDKRLAILQTEAALFRRIHTVPDSRLRLILKLRFLDCLPWAGVAKEIGKPETEDSARRAFERFLEGDDLDDDS